VDPVLPSIRVLHFLIVQIELENDAKSGSQSTQSFLRVVQEDKVLQSNLPNVVRARLCGGI